MVATVAEQVCGGQAGDGGAGREDDEPPVDERQRGGEQPHPGRRGEGKAAAPEQRQGDGRRRREGKPQRRARGVGRVVPERELERASERDQHDQRVEAVRAREWAEACHASNVLQPLAPRLIPR